MYFLLPLLIYSAVVFLAPMLLVVATSFIQLDTWHVTPEYFIHFFTEELYQRVLFNTVSIAVVSTSLTLLLGYPLAYYLARQTAKRRIFLSLLLLLPFYTSILVKSFAFSVILGRNGVINWFLQLLFGPNVVVELLYNRIGVVIGITHDMLPFLVFPIMVSLLAQDPALHRAAEIMGASRTRIFWTVTFPLSLPGVLAGVFLVLVRSMGQYAVPTLLGGRQDMMMSNLVAFHVTQVLDWNMAAAISMILLGISCVFLFALSRVGGGQFMGGKA